MDTEPLKRQGGDSGAYTPKTITAIVRAVKRGYEAEKKQQVIAEEVGISQGKVSLTKKILTFIEDDPSIEALLKSPTLTPRAVFEVTAMTASQIKSKNLVYRKPQVNLFRSNLTARIQNGCISRDMIAPREKLERDLASAKGEAFRLREENQELKQQVASLENDVDRLSMSHRIMAIPDKRDLDPNISWCVETLISKLGVPVTIKNGVEININTMNKQLLSDVLQKMLSYIK